MSKSSPSVGRELTAEGEVLSTLLRLMRGWAVVVDADGRIIQVQDAQTSSTPSFVAAPGQLHIEALEQSFGNLSAPERAQLSNLICRAAAGDDAGPLELPFGQSPEVCWLRIAAAPLGAATGQILLLHADITAPKAVEEQVRSNQVRFKALAQNSYDAVHLVDSEGNILFASPTVERVLGFSAEEICGTSGFSYIHPDDTPAVGQIFDQLARKQGGTARAEMRVRHKSGHFIWSECVATNLLHDPDVRGIVVNYRDISDRRAAQQESEERRQLLDQIINSVPDFIFIKSKEGHYIHVNRATAEFIGLAKREDMVGKSDEQIFGPEVGKQIREDDLTILRTGAPLINHEERLVDSKGRPCWVLSTKVPLRDASGEIKGIVGVAREVTELWKIQEQLRLSNQRFEYVCRATADAVWDWDIVQDSLWWSDGFQRNYGPAASDTAKGLDSWTARIHGKDKDRVLKKLAASLASSSSIWHDEYRYHASDGALRRVYDRAYIIRSEDGKAVRAVGAMVDVTERRAIEHEVKEKAALLDQANDAIVVLHLDSVVDFWNAAAEKLHGWSRDEALGRPATEFLFTNAQQFITVRDAVLHSGEWRGELTQLKKSGEVTLIESHMTLVLDDDGVASSILMIYNDITEKKQLENQLLRTQRLESLGTLAGGIAHDLNNILVPILMGAELLQDSAQDDSERQILNVIKNNAMRGANIVKQVLTFARGMHGEKAAVQIRHLIKEMVGIVRETFPKSIRVTNNVAQDLWIVKGDPTQLHQILLNLCVNARDAMPNGGALKLSARNYQVDDALAAMRPQLKAGPYVVLQVEDSGTGIPAAILEKIFEPFFTTKEVGKGTGLGLSTVLGIVQGHGGHIEVRSKPGETIFSVYLPAQVEGSADNTATPGAALFPEGNGETILVIDDEPNILNITAYILKSRGYHPITADAAPKGLALLAQNASTVALIITDIMMPVLDGLGLIRSAQIINPDIRVIASTGVDIGARREELEHLGVRSILLKPYSAQDLLQTVHAELKNRKPPASPPQ